MWTTPSIQIKQKLLVDVKMPDVHPYNETSHQSSSHLFAQGLPQLASDTA